MRVSIGDVADREVKNVPQSKNEESRSEVDARLRAHLCHSLKFSQIQSQLSSGQSVLYKAHPMMVAKDSKDGATLLVDVKRHHQHQMVNLQRYSQPQLNDHRF